MARCLPNVQLEHCGLAAKSGTAESGRLVPNPRHAVRSCSATCSGISPATCSHGFLERREDARVVNLPCLDSEHFFLPTGPRCFSSRHPTRGNFTVRHGECNTHDRDDDSRMGTARHAAPCTPRPAAPTKPRLRNSQSGTRTPEARRMIEQRCPAIALSAGSDDAERAYDKASLSRAFSISSTRAAISVFSVRSPTA